MKRILTYIALPVVAAATLIGCTELYGPDPQPEAKVEAEGITVGISEVKDSSFVVTLTPDGEAAYYSYAVFEKGTVAAVDSATLYSNGYKSKAVSSGLFKYTEEAPSATFTVDGLTPYTAYQVYAVSSSVTGVPGSVVVKEVSTSDNVAPYPVGSDYKESLAVIYFSEPVEYVEGSEVTVRYFARYSSEYNIKEDVHVGTAEVKVSAYGESVYFSVSGVPTGAYYTISYPEGTFVDAAGFKAAALNSGFTTTASGSLTYYGVYGYVTASTFAIAPKDSVAAAKKLDDAILVYPEEGVTVYNASTSVTGSLLYTYGNETRSFSSIAPGENGGYLYSWDEDYDVAVVYPNVGESYSGRALPERGSYITVTIPKGWLTDIYGNSSEELVIGPFVYSYGFTVADAVGRYQHNGASAFTGESNGTYYDYDEDPWTLTIAESDSTKLGNVMLTEYYGMELSYPIYGTFNGDSGELTVPIDYEWIGWYTSGNYAYAFYTLAYYSTMYEYETGLTLYFESPNTIAGANDYLGYYFEAYKIPEGGIGAITDDDYVGYYDYNVFIPSASYWSTVTASEASVKSASAVYPAGRIFAPKAKDVKFEKVLQK